jgi:hypothetical protein
MTDKLQQRLTAAPLTVERRLAALFWEMLPPVLFFFIALMLIFAVVKLLALQYSIRFYAFARAALVVAFKTLIYAMAVFLFEFGERLVRAWHERGSLREGLATVKANANLDHFLALLILGCMIISMYLAMEEISHAMGEGALTRLFFKRPNTA